MTITPEILDEAKQLRADGMSWTDIARRFGLGKDSIRRRLGSDAEVENPGTRADRTIDAKTLARAKQLREKGIHWTVTARRLGVGYYALRCLLDADWAEKQRERKRMGAGENMPFVHNTREPDKPTAAEVSAALKRIPEDTRDMTAIAFGDPIYERSALYRKQMGLSA